MILSANDILNGFDHLPVTDQKKVAAEILRRYQSADSPPLSDDDLTACAEVVFLALDQEEAERGSAPQAR